MFWWWNLCRTYVVSFHSSSRILNPPNSRPPERWITDWLQLPCNVSLVLSQRWFQRVESRENFSRLQRTLGPQNHEKWRFSTPNIWVITPKNEGCGFQLVSNIFYVHPYLGKMNPFWRAYFSIGLVQPPRDLSMVVNVFFKRKMSLKTSVWKLL